MVQQVVAQLTVPARYASAAEPTLRGPTWVEQQWDAARLSATSPEGAVLILDEVQKVGNWSETVKGLWDEDTRKGLTESLTGRFENSILTH